MTLVQKEPKYIKIWSTDVKKVYLGSTQVRPTITPITTPWIYHNATLGIISLSSNWSTWITIADKNLGATTVWNSWNARSEANCWKYYQWGNNYWFNGIWWASPATNSSQINAQNYWPWNYYSNSTFRTIYWWWDSSNNKNLRWWVTWTNDAMQWPCSNDFHIPLNTERQAIYYIWTGLWWWASAWSNFSATLKIPFCWGRTYANWNIVNNGTTGRYWSSIAYTDNNNSVIIKIDSSTLVVGDYVYRSFACPIRPFKNEAVQPDDSRTKLK